MRATAGRSRKRRPQFAANDLGTSLAKDRLSELERGNKWRPMPDEQFAGLEPAYQRYVRQG